MPLWNNVQYATLEPDDKRSLEHVRNPYFNFFEINSEQDLLNSIVAESVQFSGVEFYYIKRETPNLDTIFGEDPTNIFTKFWKIAAYIETYEGWQGQADFYTKFGMVVNDEASVIVQPDLFAHQTNGYSPTSGDLLYWPQKTAKSDYVLFEIIWVEPDNPFHPNGTLPFRRMNIQKFAYSNEKMELVNDSQIADTDIPPDILDELIELTDRGDVSEPPYKEADQIQTEGDAITVFDENDPFGARF